MHKVSLEILVGLSIDKNNARQVHGRAFEKMKWKTEKALTLRSQCLIRKEVNISEVLVRMVGVEPDLITIKSRVPDR